MNEVPVLVAKGWNQRSSLARLSPQGLCPGIQESQRDYAFDRTVTIQGRYVPIKYKFMTGDTFQAVNDQFGISLYTLNADVTIAIPGPTRNSLLFYNGTVAYPEAGGGYETFTYNNVTYTISALFEVTG
jgi:hypothetical protein